MDVCLIVYVLCVTFHSRVTVVSFEENLQSLANAHGDAGTPVDLGMYVHVHYGIAVEKYYVVCKTYRLV